MTAVFSSAQWTWGEGNFVLRKFPAGGNSQLREKDLRNLHWSATRHVRAEAPARRGEAVGSLAGRWPKESHVGQRGS